MDRKRTLLLTLGAVLVVTAVIAVVSGDDVIAQVRAAWTKNVDEPGLVPFSLTFAVNQNQCSCVNCCFVNGAPVAAGKRLVIKNVSGFVSLQAAANLGPISLDQVGGGNFVTIATIPAQFRNQWNGGNYPAYEFNEEVLAYVDAGNMLRFGIYTGGEWGFQGGEVTINGYVVSLQ